MKAEDLTKAELQLLIEALGAREQEIATTRYKCSGDYADQASISPLRMKLRLAYNAAPR